jgi:hypothetical protein
MIRDTDKPQEWSLAGGSIRTAVVIALVFGLAIGIDYASHWLVEAGHIERDGLDYWCLRAVSIVAKVSESIAIVAIMIKHAAAIVCIASGEIGDRIRSVIKAWTALKS